MPDPANPYAATMVASEHLIRSYVISFKFPAIIARVCNVYGPRQSKEKLVINSLSRALQGKSCVVEGTGAARRFWLYVDDFCAAMDTVLFKGAAGATYNIGP